MRTLATLVALCPLIGLAAADDPLVYLPFDQDVVVGVGRLDAASIVPEPPDVQPGGIEGECLHVASDLRLPAEGNIAVVEGTIAFWMRADWQDSDRTHTLFCLYGGESPNWLHNRWTLWAGGSHLRASVYPRAGQERVELAVASPFADGEWHHVAWTWRGINSDRADAELALYVDGVQVAGQSGLQLNVGRIGPQIDIGRDSDGSPDFADALYDEFYLYPVALSAETIRRAVEMRSETGAATGEGGAQRIWSNADRNCRFEIEVELPAGPAGAVTARVPLRIENDLAQLGLTATPSKDSLLVRDAQTESVVPHAVEGQDLLLKLSSDGKAQTRRLIAGFGLIRYDFSRPLAARRQTPRGTVSGDSNFEFADYAQVQYGDAWDFDEGDMEGIERWGNKPSYVQNQRVEDGVLKMTVSKDPWFAWGDPWPNPAEAKKGPVAIDLDQFNLLEMRIRQSCPGAEWTVFGLPIGGTLKSYDFRVQGTDWQTVRIDLREDARFHGILSALRIDPTNDLENVEIEIDWIRITRTVPGERQAVQIAPPRTALPVKIALEAGATEIVVGSKRVVDVRVLNAMGQPVAGWPVRFSAAGAKVNVDRTPKHPSLAIASTDRRALTDADGRTSVAVDCSPRAGKQTTGLAVTCEFAKNIEAAFAWDTLEGPADHYRVSPIHPSIVREQELPLVVTAQLVDGFDNPLAEPGRRIVFKTPDGMTAEPASVTTNAAGKADCRIVFDTGKRWVGTVHAVDGRGLEGESAPISVALDGRLPFTYRLLPNGYFATSDGRPFVPLGGFYANWVQSETPNGEWDQCNPFHATTDAEKRLWLAKLAENGVTALRFMLRTHRRDPGMDGTEALDAGGRVNRRLFSEILRYMDLAREYDIVFLAVVHDDYNKPIYCNPDNYRKFTGPAFAGVDLDALPPHQRRFVRDGDLLIESGQKYTDADAIACQDMYARELTRFLKNCPAVFAYELENEMVRCPASWTNHAIAVLREGDPNRPICVSHGGGGMLTADPLWWQRKTDIDFYTYHLYPHSNRCTTPEMDYGLATDVLTRYGRMSGVSFYGESSGDQFRDDTNRERRRWVMRDLIWISLTNGNPGCFFWNARLSEVAEFAAARDAMSRLDLMTFERAKPPIAVLVPHPLDDDRYYRDTEAGREAYEMMGRYCRHYQQLGVDFDFALKAEGYTQTADLTTFSPPVPAARPLQAAKGLETTYLARADWSEGLIYVRNISGIEPVELKHGRGMSVQYLRTRRPLPWRLRLALPDGSYELRIYDLDTRKTTNTVAASNGTLDLGTTDHDMAIVLKRR